jgi:ubiquinol-cytochrome c reductase cytochrome b subunit
LPVAVIGTDTGPVFQGAVLFDERGCLNCHMVKGWGGRRGPDLTYIGDELTQANMVIRIVNGGVNMPAFGSTLKPAEIDALVAFLSSRKRLEKVAAN